MVAERVYCPSPPLQWELEFRSPSWYVPKKRWPGKHCLFHGRYCETVERDLEILNPLSPKEKKKKKMQKKKERKERSIKMEEYARELRVEREAKRKREQKKLRRKKMKMTEEEKKMMEEKEKEEDWRKMKEEFWKGLEREQKMKMKSQLPAPVEWTIKKGDKFDITHLLSSRKRDYLIKNNGDKVKVKELCGKHVVLYFWWLTYDGLYERYSKLNALNADLEEIYRAYNPVGAFEVVFVALGKNKDVFNVSFSRVPWLAIPHKDQKARDLLRTKFAIPFPTSARAVLFAPDGTVLLKDCEDNFRTYGAEGFPFTKQKKQDIRREADALWDELVVKKQKLSLNALLGDYVISSEGDQVSTSSLEGKIVGLYFFEVSYMGFERTRELLKIWKKAKDRLYENFEIVFINEASTNLSFAKEQFKEEFRCTIPWYSLPVDGRKLCEVFRIGLHLYASLKNAGYFIVLEPDWYQPISYFAFDILVEFGIDAYPFVLEKAVMIEKIKQQEKLVLGELLSSSAPLRRGFSSCFKEEDTTVSKLLRKPVLLFFATHSCYRSGLFLTALKRMYLEKKGTGDDFEIIYISLDCDESPSSFPLSIQEMPWLVHSYVPDFAASLAQMVFKHPFHLPAIAAFGPDGHLVTKECNLAFKKEWNSRYPFIEADMCKEVHRELQIRHNWDLDKLQEYENEYE